MTSAVVIVVPEAERFVGALRAQYDPVANGGVPAHVTLLFPFRTELDDQTFRDVGEIAAATEPFELTFGTVEMFSDGVVYLAPRPDEPVRELMRALAARFPDCPPYEGLIEDPTPHLTVGHRLPPETAASLIAELERLPAFTTTVSRLTLFVASSEGRWKIERHWPLGTPAV